MGYGTQHGNNEEAVEAVRLPLPTLVYAAREEGDGVGAWVPAGPAVVRNDESSSAETIISVGEGQAKTFQIVMEDDVRGEWKLPVASLPTMRCCRNRHYGNYIEQMKMKMNQCTRQNKTED